MQQQRAGNNGNGRRDGNAMATVMDGNGWCDGNVMVTATTAMEGVTAMQRQHDGNERRNSNSDKWSNDNTTAMKAMAAMDGGMAKATAMDGTMVTEMKGAMAMQQQ